MSGTIVTECMSNTAPGSCTFTNRAITVDTERYEGTLAAARMYCAREGGRWTDDPR
jgi:putative hemolysin